MSRAGWATRALTGTDEWLLHDARTAGATPAECTTALLAEVAGETQATVRAWTVGTRERRLVDLYCATFGPALDLLATCPCCGGSVEIEVAAKAVLAPSEPAAPEGSCVAGGLEVRFRLPTGGDQERAARAARDGLAEAVRDLVARCILAVDGEEGGAPVGPGAHGYIPGHVADAVEQAMSRHDPDAVIAATVTCPDCSAQFRTVLDPFRLVAAAITPPEALLAEVGQLARAYHWREADILAIPLPRRRRYLEMAGDDAELPA